MELVTESLLTTTKIRQAIDDSDLAEASKRKYRAAINQLVKAQINPFDFGELQRFANALGASTRSHLKAALAIVARQTELALKAAATGERAADTMALLWQLEAMTEAVQVKQSSNQRRPHWLSRAEVIALADHYGGDDTLCMRDRVLLGLMLVCGLRRSEAVSVTFSDVSTVEIKGDVRAVLSVLGKGSKRREIPIKSTFAKLLAEWQKVIGCGRIVRSVDKVGRIGNSLSVAAVYKIVQKAGHSIGKDDLQPHDLRRTYAQLGFEAGVSITQLSKLLGHASVATTQRYLNLDLDLATTAGDFVPFD